MTDALVAVEHSESGVVTVRLARPKANVLSLAMLEELFSIFSDMAADPPGAVVIWGGPVAFSAGADLGELAAGEAAEKVAVAFHRCLAALEDIPRCSIAALDGYVLGGGLELALACDFRVAGPRAILGLPEVTLGIIPGGGGTQRLPRLVGMGRAKDLILSGRKIGPEEAARIGLVERVAGEEGAYVEALGWAGELASGALSAQELAKRVIAEGAPLAMREALALEAVAFSQACRSEDAKIGIAHFRTRSAGQPNFRPPR